MSKIRTNYNKFINDIDSKNVDTARESLRLFNIALSKAVKRGVIKKINASRKLAS